MGVACLAADNDTDSLLHEPAQRNILTLVEVHEGGHGGAEHQLFAVWDAADIASVAEDEVEGV